MEVQTTTSTQSTASTSQTANQTSSDSPLSSDFETFLLMLTTQMQNQDPLNPIESQDFAVQLATFSGVEQQVRTNELLQNLSGGLGLTGLSQLAGWVGMEARVSAPAVFNGSPIELVPDADPGADAAELIVLNAYGQEVSRQALSLGTGTVEWAGVGDNGSPLEPGEYSFQIASYSQGEVTSIQTVPHYARINEARQGLDGIELVTEGGIIVPSDEVSALRAPSVD